MAIWIGATHSAMLLVLRQLQSPMADSAAQTANLGAFAAEVHIQGCGKDAFLPAHPTESSNTCEGRMHEELCSHRVGARPLLLHEIEYASNSLSKYL